MHDLSRFLGRRVLLGGLAVLAVGTLAGCGPRLPRTYPVQGHIVYKGRGNLEQLTGAYVQCRLESDPEILAVGQIEEEGAFTLGTVLAGQGFAGAVPGTYRVRIAPPDEYDEGEDIEGQAVWRGVHPRYQSFDRSPLRMTVNAETNTVSLEVESIRR